MNYTYVLGFMVLRDLVRVFPISSPSFARKTTRKNRAQSHPGARRGFQIGHVTTPASPGPVLTGRRDQSPVKSCASRSVSCCTCEKEDPLSHLRIQVRSADIGVAPGRRQFQETR